MFAQAESNRRVQLQCFRSFLGIITQYRFSSMAGHKITLACIVIYFGFWGIIVDGMSTESSKDTLQTNSQASGNEQRPTEVKHRLQALKSDAKSGYLGRAWNDRNELHIHQSGTLHLRLGTVEIHDREGRFNVSGAHNQQLELRHNETITAINLIRNDTTYVKGRIDRLDEISAELRALRSSYDRIAENIASKKSSSIEMGNVTIQRASRDSSSMEDTTTEKREGNQTLPSDCWEIFQGGYDVSGVYYIRSPTANSTALKVYCQMDIHGGGWTVFQNRQDGNVNFFRRWNEYSSGFGDVDGEFWLGLEYIHRLTNHRIHELLIELEDFEGHSLYALYDKFAVGSDADGYPVSGIGVYIGNAGDSLFMYNNHKFTTWDKDNDDGKGNLALKYIGGWWYRGSHYSDLNGPYLRGPTPDTPLEGVYWYNWRGYYSLRKTRMSIRPKVT